MNTTHCAPNCHMSLLRIEVFRCHYVFIFCHLDFKSLIGLVNQLACKLAPICACELVSKFVELATCKSLHHWHMQTYVTICLQPLANEPMCEFLLKSKAIALELQVFS